MENSDEIVLSLPDDVHKLCRTCMAVTEEALNHDVVVVDIDKIAVAGDWLHSITSLQIIPNDGLPKSICDECATKLQIAYDFKQQCEQTETSLRELLSIPVEPVQENPAKKKNPTELVKNPCNKPENTSNNAKQERSIVLYESNTKDLPDNNLVFSLEDGTVLDPQPTVIIKRTNKKPRTKNSAAVSKMETDQSSDFDITKLIEERKSQTNGEEQTTIDVDDMVLLIEERKRNTKEEINDNFPENTIASIKREVFSDEDYHNEFVCKYCEVTFTDIEKLGQHLDQCSQMNQPEEYSDQIVVENFLKLEHDEDSNGLLTPISSYKIYTCDFCDLTFKSIYSKNGHMQTHGPTEKIKFEHGCDLCNKIFSTESKLATHFQKHAVEVSREINISNSNSLFEGELFSDEMLTCYICPEKFETSGDLNKHIKLQHTKSGLVTCEICANEFLGEVSLVKHLKTHGINIFLCKICLKRFDSPTKLKDHLKQHQLENKRNIFRCPICKKEFPSTNSLRTHSIVHLNDEYECSRCKKKFNNHVAFETHQKQHTEPRFLCSLCGKQYFSSVTLASHMRAHNNEKPFSCPHCKKGFSSRATLSVHKRIHSSFKPYICSYCGYSCRQSGDLAMHIRTHTGDKPYKCNFPNCDRKFTTSSQRKEHYRRHTNERNHKCKICEKAFLESKTLKVHMLTHTGEKPHTCGTCGKRFRRSHHLANHMKGHKEPSIPE